MSKSTICLNMIVKDEEHIILRTLNNLTNYINFDYWVISDTGSTDSTKEIIRDFFNEKNIPGELIEIPWKDFAYNRTEALNHAYNKTDYVFIFDADDEIMGDFTLPKIMNKDFYKFQYGDKHGIRLTRPQLFNNRIKWKYVGVLHEYAESVEPTKSSELISGNYYFTLGHEGSRSKDPEKYHKDAIILEKAFYDTAKDTNKYLHSRYAYYCAQSYAACKNTAKSLEFYKKVLELEGWLEEKYVSCIRIHDMLENKEEGLYYLDKASEYNRNRIECIYRLVNYYLLKNDCQKSHDYYKRIQNYYENDFLNDGIKDSCLCINITEYNFYLPYSMIIVADRINNRSIGIKMYEIIFKYKFTDPQQFYITHLFGNLKFFYKEVTDKNFFVEMRKYIELLRAKNLVVDDSYLKDYVMPGPKTTPNDVLVTILAKDKGHTLPFYLKCIYNQTYPKKNIHLYVRTNDNNDNTVELLTEFINKYGDEYASVYYNDDSVSETLKQYKNHEWNTERFKILGKIRQDSADYAKKLGIHYFVADCDNFIVPETIEKLFQNSHNGVIAPMLMSDSRYSNFHYDIDKNGYYKGHDLYNKILEREIKGLIEVPVVHCTYFINNKFLPNVLYDDNSFRYEYVIFSDKLRKTGSKQYLDNQFYFGFLIFASGTEEVTNLFNSKWNNIIAEKFKSENNEKKTLIIAPNGGFGNRLRTMVSAIYLAEKLNMNIEHLWVGTQHKCAFKHIQDIHDKSFEHFFKESIKRCDYNTMVKHVNKTYTEWMPNSNPHAWHNFQSYGQKLLETSVLSNLDLVNEQMNNSENFLIETTYINNLKITDKEINHIYAKYFIPRDEFTNKLNNVEINTIGISIRKGDFESYFPDSVIENSVMVKWLKSLDNPVLLFSDDDNYAEEMRKYLKNPIRPMLEGDDTFFLSFLLLSKCSKIYGTLSSSFSEEASKFGGVEYVALTKDFFST